MLMRKGYARGTLTMVRPWRPGYLETRVDTVSGKEGHKDTGWMNEPPTGL